MIRSCIVWFSVAVALPNVAVPAPSATDVIVSTSKEIFKHYPVRAANSLATNPFCSQNQSHLQEALEYGQAIRNRSRRRAVSAIASFQRRLYCLGGPGMRAMDLALGEAIRRSLDLAPSERDRAVQSLFNLSILVVDALMFTQRSYSATVLRLYNRDVSKALSSFPYQDVGIFVLRPNTGSIVRLPAMTCTAKRCDRTEYNILNMFVDVRRFGTGVCNWLFLAHSQFVCSAGLACGAERPNFEALTPAGTTSNRWQTYGSVRVGEARLRHTTTHGAHLVANTDLTAEVQAREYPPMSRSDNRPLKMVAPSRSLDAVAVSLRTPAAESRNIQRWIFGQPVEQEELEALCGGVLEPHSLPWSTPSYPYFECLLNERREHERAVDCFSQGLGSLAKELRVHRFDVGGGNGALDPDCESNPFAEEPLAPRRSYTCADVPEYCAGVGGTASSSTPNLTPAENQKAVQGVIEARRTVDKEAEVYQDLMVAALDRRKGGDIREAIKFGIGVRIEFGAFTFSGECLDAAACYDDTANIIYVQQSAVREYPRTQFVGAIVHEIMHAALKHLGIPKSAQHQYIEKWGATVVEEEEGAEINVPTGRRMPGPEDPGCSVFARQMKATLECVSDLARPRVDVKTYTPWKDPRVSYPKPNDPAADGLHTCSEYLKGGDIGGGPRSNPCQYLHCIDPGACWCQQGGGLTIRVLGELQSQCGWFTQCGPELELDPVTCMCVPIGGIEKPDLPGNPLGVLWGTINDRLKSRVDPVKVLFPPRQQPANLFPR